jgi:hypothetical protein
MLPPDRSPDRCHPPFSQTWHRPDHPTCAVHGCLILCEASMRRQISFPSLLLSLPLRAPLLSTVPAPLHQATVPRRRPGCDKSSSLSPFPCLIRRTEEPRVPFDGAARVFLPPQGATHRRPTASSHEPLRRHPQEVCTDALPLYDYFSGFPELLSTPSPSASSPIASSDRSPF